MMLNGRLILTTGITHGLALLLGWAAWTFREREVRKGETAAESADQRQHRVEGAKTAEQILAIIAPQKPQISSAEWKIRNAKFKSEFIQLLETMPKPDNLAAALEDELKQFQKHDDEPSARMAVLIYQWANSDLPGLLKWMNESKIDGLENAIATYFGVVFQQLVSANGMDSVLPLSNDKRWGDSVLIAISSTLGETTDTRLLAEFKEKVAPRQWDAMKFFLAARWPWEERSKLVDFALAEKQPGLLASLARRGGKEQSDTASWIFGMIHDESLDAGFRKKLSQDRQVKDLALSRPDLPMDQRIALLQGGASTPADQRLYDEIAETDAAKQFMEGRDWSYEFHHGKVDANEVLAGISAGLTETNEKSSDALRTRVFKNLVEEDPSRAMELLNGLAPDKRADAVLDAAKNVFYSENPETFLSALQQVPADDPQHWDARLAAWVQHGPENYDQLDADYVSWVRALPDGVDRDMALYSLALATSKNQPELASALRSEVKNETLRQKLPAKP